MSFRHFNFRCLLVFFHYSFSRFGVSLSFTGLSFFFYSCYFSHFFYSIFITFRFVFFLFQLVITWVFLLRFILVMQKKERKEKRRKNTLFLIRFLSLPFVSHFYTLYPHLFVNSFLSFLLHFLSVISFVSHFSHDFPISFYHRSSTMSSLSSPFAIFSSHFFDSLIPLLSFAFFSLIPFIPLFSYSFPRVFLFHSFHYFPLLSHAAAQRRPNARQRK